MNVHIIASPPTNEELRDVDMQGEPTKVIDSRGSYYFPNPVTAAAFFGMESTVLKQHFIDASMG